MQILVRSAAHSICNSKNNIPKKTSIVFHNGYNYNYYFIIKEIAEECEGQFLCSQENTEKYITFSVLKKSVSEIDKKRKKKLKNCPADYNLLTVQDSRQAQ